VSSISRRPSGADELCGRRFLGRSDAFGRRCARRPCRKSWRRRLSGYGEFWAPDTVPPAAICSGDKLFSLEIRCDLDAYQWSRKISSSARFSPRKSTRATGPVRSCYPWHGLSQLDSVGENSGRLKSGSGPFRCHTKISASERCGRSNSTPMSMIREICRSGGAGVARTDENADQPDRLPAEPKRELPGNTVKFSARTAVNHTIREVCRYVEPSPKYWRSYYCHR